MNSPYRRVLLLGGTSEIGGAIIRAMRLPPDAEVIVAVRDVPRGDEVASTFGCRTTIEQFDALDPDSVSDVITRTFSAGRIDLVIPAFGVLGDQDLFEADPAQADALLTVNVVAQVRALLEAAKYLSAQGGGTLVVLSSVAAVRPRRANFVYGSSKAALDAAARGLGDALHRTGVRVVLVRPGFVIGRMTAGMRPAPMSTTPEVVATHVASALSRGTAIVWVPSQLRVLAWVLRTVPRPLWRRLRR